MTLLINKAYKRFLTLFLIKLVFPLKNLIYEMFHSDYTIITSSVKPLSYNWGDDVSIQLCKMVNPQRKYIVNRYTWNLFRRDDVLCIGSIINWMTSPNSIIWGSGIVYPDRELSAIPKKVLAVRGPLTRQYLLKRGIDCPEVYGDPALLFPRYYKPHIEKKYRLGIIPHFRDKNNPIILKNSQDSTVKVIDVQKIQPWHRFIDEICSCEYIASSSLHGLIISDAYGIPNVWIEFEGGEQKRFAFHDYLQSVKKDTDPLILSLSTTIEDICNMCNNIENDINLDKLMNSCPFKH